MALRLAVNICGIGGRCLMAANIRTIVPSKITPICVGGYYKSCVRGYAMRQELTEHGIVWRRPEKIPSWKPQKSGDIKECQPPSLDRLRLDIQPAASYLDQVDDITKELLTLRFSHNRERKRAEMYDTMRRIQRHQYDSKSIEVRIAKMTVTIRNMQAKVAVYKRNKVQRIRLQELIAKRKKMLKHLRSVDYKRFEWLIEELAIIYRPSPWKHIRITRKGSLERLVELHGKELREKRMAAYKASLEQQKTAYLKEKEDTHQWIAKTESNIGIPVSVPTISHKTKD